MAFMVIVYSKPSARIQEAQFAIADLSNGTWHHQGNPFARQTGARLDRAWPDRFAAVAAAPA
jgi:hypothetical protein